MIISKWLIRRRKNSFPLWELMVLICKPFLLEKGRGPSFWEIWSSFNKNCFVPSLVKISYVVLEKKTFKFYQCIFHFQNYLPLEKNGPLFEQTWIPFTQGCFVPSLVEIGPVVLEKKMKMWKVYRQTTGAALLAQTS